VCVCVCACVCVCVCCVCMYMFAHTYEYLCVHIYTVNVSPNYTALYTAGNESVCVCVCVCACVCVCVCVSQESFENFEFVVFRWLVWVRDVQMTGWIRRKWSHFRHGRCFAEKAFLKRLFFDFKKTTCRMSYLCKAKASCVKRGAVRASFEPLRGKTPTIECTTFNNNWAVFWDLTSHKTKNLILRLPPMPHQNLSRSAVYSINHTKQPWGWLSRSLLISFGFWETCQQTSQVCWWGTSNLEIGTFLWQLTIETQLNIDLREREREREQNRHVWQRERARDRAKRQLNIDLIWYIR